MNVDEWREHNDRPQWIKRNRREIEADTGKSVPRSIPRIREWADRHRGVVTQLLTEDDE